MTKAIDPPNSKESEMIDAGFVYREPDKSHPKYKLAKEICEDEWISYPLGDQTWCKHCSCDHPDTKYVQMDNVRVDFGSGHLESKFPKYCDRTLDSSEYEIHDN